MRRVLLVLLATAGLIGCEAAADDFVLGPTDADVSGTFALKDINGGLLPVLARQTTTERWDLTADTMVVAGDSTWVETSRYMVTTVNGGATRQEQTQASGVYRITNAQIAFTMRVGGTSTFTGSVQGNALIVVFNDTPFTYTRAQP
jgi:hypothetical protein